MLNGLRVFHWDILNPASDDTHETHLLHHGGDEWETVVSFVTPRETYFFHISWKSLSTSILHKSLTSDRSSQFFFAEMSRYERLDGDEEEGRSGGAASISLKRNLLVVLLALVLFATILGNILLLLSSLPPSWVTFSCFCPLCHHPW